MTTLVRDSLSLDELEEALQRRLAFATDTGERAEVTRILGLLVEVEKTRRIGEISRTLEEIGRRLGR